MKAAAADAAAALAAAAAASVLTPRDRRIEAVSAFCSTLRALAAQSWWALQGSTPYGLKVDTVNRPLWCPGGGGLKVRQPERAELVGVVAVTLSLFQATFIALQQEQG